MTTTTRRLSTLLPPSVPRLRALARDARSRHPRAPALYAAMLCAASLCADAAQARKPRAPKAASVPSTAQILAPSAATVPDALPPDQLIYRCGNTYSSHACADAKPLAVADARSDAQRRQSQELTARDKRLAAWLEAERHEREFVASAPKNERVAKTPKECVVKTRASCKPNNSRQPRVVAAAAAASPAARKSK